MFWSKKVQKIESEEYKKLALRLFEVEQALESVKISVSMALDEQKTFNAKINALKRLKIDTEAENDNYKKSDKVYM